MCTHRLSPTPFLIFSAPLISVPAGRLGMPFLSPLSLSPNVIPAARLAHTSLLPFPFLRTEIERNVVVFLAILIFLRATGK